MMATTSLFRVPKIPILQCSQGWHLLLFVHHSQPDQFVG